MNTLSFDLVTPQATFFSGQVQRVEAPGVLGDFGVLLGHMPFISTLRPGIVTILDAHSAVKKLFVAGGLAEVNPKSCTVLAEQVVDLTNFTRADAESRLLKAKTAAEKALGDEAQRLADEEVRVSEELLRAVS